MKNITLEELLEAGSHFGHQVTRQNPKARDYIFEARDNVHIIDTHLEDLAVREAIATRVKTVGITDTNADPTIIDYPIPANDDAVGSVQLIVSHIVDAFIEGRKNAGKEEAKAEKALEKEVLRQAQDEKKEAKKESIKAEEKPVEKKAKDKTDKPVQKKTTKKSE